MKPAVRITLAILLLLVAFGPSIPVGPIIPTAKPIDLPGFNVLVLTDTSAGTASDQLVMRHPTVQSWLAANSDEWHAWDDSHTDFKYVEPQWEAAYKKAIEDSNGERSWVLVSGKGGVSQKLPGEPAAFVALMEKYK